MANIVGCSVADGQLPNTKGTLYTVPAGKIFHLTHICLANTSDTTPYVVNIYLKRSGSVSRQLTGRNVSLPASQSIDIPGTSAAIRLSAGDVIEGDADTAAVVDYLISGGLEIA